MSIHAILEGIALGLMKNLPNVINLLISILVHKFAESMTICLAMQRANMSLRKIILLMGLFSFVAPIGTIMGILLGTAPDIVGIVFMSLAGGSFIYVACSELIVEEFSHPGKKWLKLLAFCLGAIFIGLLLLLE